MQGRPPRNSSAIARKATRFASMPMPMAQNTGPISRAMVCDVLHVSCPFAGMTRIRFKGFFSAPTGAPLGTGLM